MFKRQSTRTAAAGAIALLMSAGMASALTLQVKVTNLQDEGGLFLTPLFSIFHDGTYDSFTAGEKASDGVEAIAEDGDPGPELAATDGLNTGVITAPGGFPGAPVLDPGETATMTFTVDPMVERFFSYLTMIIPSNDLFLGNGNQLANPVFDEFGNFIFSTIMLSESNVYDAGTEDNDNLGAAFNANGGEATETDVMIQLISELGGFQFLNGEPTAAGTNVFLGDNRDLLKIEISVVPVPAALPLLLAGLGALGFAGRRRPARHRPA